MSQTYLDPKNDIVFKRIFGEHPNILKSFLNALLPLPEDGQIESLEYLPADQAPVLPLLKHSIVDVRCQDQQGRYFIVEMQMNWTSAFLQRVLFNASKAYVRQLDKGEDYKLLQPVIGLSILDDTFDHQTDQFYHHYQMINVDQPDRLIEGLQLVFIELPKFNPSGKLARMKRAWLRFLRETGAKESAESLAVITKEIASESSEIQQALELTGEAAYSKIQLAAYDRYWDAVSSERTLFNGAHAEGKAEGKAEGRAEGKAEGIAEGESKGLAKGLADGRALERAALLSKLIASGMSAETASQLLDLN